MGHDTSERRKYLSSMRVAPQAGLHTDIPGQPLSRNRVSGRPSASVISLAWISTEGEFPNIRNANRFTRLKNFAVTGRPIGALMEACA